VYHIDEEANMSRKDWTQEARELAELVDRNDPDTLKVQGWVHAEKIEDLPIGTVAYVHAMGGWRRGRVTKVGRTNVTVSLTTDGAVRDAMDPRWKTYVEKNGGPRIQRTSAKPTAIMYRPATTLDAAELIEEANELLDEIEARHELDEDGITPVDVDTEGDHPELAEALAEKPVRSSEVIAAIEDAWTVVQERHPDVPEVFVTIGSGSKPGRQSGLTYGHFAALRWSTKAGDRDELFVGGEGMERGAVDVLGTIIHEAAHGVAHTRQERAAAEALKAGQDVAAARKAHQDTSGKGAVYHNARFKAIAESMGLTIEHDKKIGYSVTHVPVETVAAYRDVLDRLEAALKVFRRPDGPRGGSGAKKDTNLRKATCTVCGSIIRLSPKVAELGAIDHRADRGTFEFEEA
jgi:hypothetical protein